MKNDFFNLYTHGFARVAVAIPRCKIADPAFNAAQTIALARQAQQQGAVLVAYPELGLSAYTCDDLFHQAALLDACEAALGVVVDASRDIDVALIVGLPLEFCIEQKIAVFEGGAQGEHKMARGFLPTKTWSAHWLAHPAFADAIERFLEREKGGIDEYIDELNDRNPFKET